MEDSAINLAIAKLEYPDYKIESWIGRTAVFPVRHPNIRGMDYMEWFWIGPIIEREKIGLALVHGDVYRAYSNEVFAIDKSPTKAAALCYLKMKENKRDHASRDH